MCSYPYTQSWHRFTHSGTHTGTGLHRGHTCTSLYSYMDLQTLWGHNNTIHTNMHIQTLTAQAHMHTHRHTNKSEQRTHTPACTHTRNFIHYRSTMTHIHTKVPIHILMAQAHTHTYSYSYMNRLAEWTHTHQPVFTQGSSVTIGTP